MAGEKVPEDAALDSQPNGVAAAGDVMPVSKFEDPRWVVGTWDLKQFEIDGKTNWDAVIDAGEVLLFPIPIFLALVVLPLLLLFGCSENVGKERKLGFYLV